MKVQFYTTEKLGPKQSLTPEGYLLCLEVPLARTGTMIYGSDETPIKAGKDGLVRIHREESEVFNELTLASANGKSVVDEHPEEDVIPDNWLELTKGICLNPRRGLGAMDDLMVGDLLITVPESIKAIQDGKLEISLGYDATYEEVAEGQGKQTNIIINHIALVESGRCGPRCAIGDQKPNLTKEPKMAKKEKATFKDLLMRAFKAKDADEIEKIADEAAEELTKDEGADNSGDTHIHLHTGGELGNSKASQEGNTTVDEEAEAEKAAAKAKDDDLESRFASLEARLTALEAAAGTTGDADMNEETEDALEEEAPANAAKEEARKAKDSAFLVDSFQETVSLAEIIAPGIRIPTFDRSVRPAQSLRTICNLRSSALDLAYAQPVTRGMIEEVLAGKTFDTKTMTCDAARNLFRSVALLKKAANNSNINSHSSFSATVNDGQQKRGVKSIADLNKANQAYYAGK